MIINKNRNMFSRMTVAGYDRTTGVALFMDFWKYVKTASLRVRI